MTTCGLRSSTVRGMLGLALMAAGWTAHAGELRGRIELQSRKGKQLSYADAQHGVVYFHPASGVATEPAPAPIRLSTRNKSFEPHVLPVTVGSTVIFPNQDPILHNAFSVSPGNDFDVGLYGMGDGEQQTFMKPGLVRVFCNVHHSMSAYVVVLDTPHFTTPNADGSFALTGLPEGPGSLTVWQEQAEIWTQEVSLPLDDLVTVTLVIKQRRVPKHLNKLGRPYRHGDHERYD